MQLPCTSSLMDGTIRQGYTPSCRILTTRAAMTSLCAYQKANLAIRGVLHASTCALPVRNLRHAPCEQNTPRRSRRISHTCPRKEPIQSESNYPAWPLSVRGISYIYRVRFRTGPHPCSRACGGLVRCTARTTRTLPCRPGTVPNATTAATRLLSRHSRSRRLHSRHAHLRVTTPRLHSTKLPFTLTPGDAAAMLSHGDRHLPCIQRPHTRCHSHHTRSLTHTPCLIHTHTTLLTHVGALTRDVSFTRGGSHTRAVSSAHAAPFACGAPFTHGV